MYSGRYDSLITNGRNINILLLVRVPFGPLDVKSPEINVNHLLRHQVGVACPATTHLALLALI